jgi:putative ABC transport system permease protein
MITMLRLLHWPFWKRAPLAAVLPVLGVALGVATIVAIDLAGANAVRSFRETLERIDGRTTHRVVGREVPDDLARTLAMVPGVEAAAPVMEAIAMPFPGGEPLRLLGIDPLSEGTIRSLGVERALGGSVSREFLARPGALLVSRAYLGRHRLDAGQPIELIVGARRASAHVLGALPDEVGGVRVPDDLAVGDIATLQELTGRFRGVSRVDLVIPEQARAEAEAGVRALLPPGTRLERPGGQAKRLERSLAAFRSNIGVLSYVALFVSFFLIYNSLLLAVLRRRPLLGIARCLGATRHQVLTAWLGEALLIGSLGVAAGLALGILLARPALRTVSRTAQDLYGGLGGGTVVLQPGTFVKAAAFGLGFTVLCALFPAREAAATPPAHTSARSGIERATRRSRGRVRVAALLLTLLLLACIWWPTTSPLPGYLACVCLGLLAALVVPDVLDLTLAAALSTRWGLRGGILRLATANIRGSSSRTGVAVAALTVALSMSVAMGTLVRSFRGDLVEWIERSVRADIYVSPRGLEADREGAVLPVELEERLRGLPAVEAVDTYRGGPVRVAGREALLAAVDVGVSRGRADWSVLAGSSSSAFAEALMRGQAGISETLHRKTGIGVGDRIPLIYEGRPDTLTVAAVYRDYSTDRGVVLVDRAAFSRRHVLGPPRSLALYLWPGTDVEATLSDLEQGAGRDFALLIRSNRELRQRVLAVFERTFSITYAMEVIGIAVAAIGILSALLAMLLERGRELATMRALGLTRRQLAGMFLSESSLLALLAWVFAAVTGAALAWILISVINVRSFGWAIPYRLPWGSWLATLLSSLLAAWAATLWPLHRLARMSVAPMLREE